MLHVRTSSHGVPRPPATGRHRDLASRRHRSLVVGASVVVAGLVLATIPGSAPAAGPTTEVAFVPLSPAKVVMNNTYVGANATSSVAVAEGSTTVPTGTTTVQLSVSVKGSKGGTLKVFPMGLPASGDAIAYPANNVVATATVNETVGLSDKVSVTNASAASATVTVKILGYSTQVTAAGINGSGGAPGQVLTDTGAGAAWAPASTAVGGRGGPIPMTVGSYTQVGSITVPAGSYFVEYSGDVYDTAAAANLYCFLQGPSNALIDYAYVSTAGQYKDTQIVLQGLLRTTGGGTVQVMCDPYVGGSPSMYDHSLTAVSVGAVSGSFGAASRLQSPTLPAPHH